MALMDEQQGGNRYYVHKKNEIYDEIIARNEPDASTLQNSIPQNHIQQNHIPQNRATHFLEYNRRTRQYRPVPILQYARD